MRSFEEHFKHLCDKVLCPSSERTYPRLHDICFPVELEEGRVLIQLGFPLSCRFLQIGHLASQALHLGCDVLHMVIVLRYRRENKTKHTLYHLKVFQGIQEVDDRARTSTERFSLRNSFESS